MECSSDCLSKYDICMNEDNCLNYDYKNNEVWSSCASKKTTCSTNCVKEEKTCNTECVSEKSEEYDCQTKCGSVTGTYGCVDTSYYVGWCESRWGFNYPCLKTKCSEYGWTWTCSSYYDSCKTRTVCTKEETTCDTTCVKEEETCESNCVSGWVVKKQKYCQEYETYDCNTQVSCESSTGPCHKQEYKEKCLSWNNQTYDCTKSKTVYYQNQTSCESTKPVINDLRICDENSCYLSELEKDKEYVVRFSVGRVYHEGRTNFKTVINGEETITRYGSYKSTNASFTFIPNNSKVVVTIIDDYTGLSNSKTLSYTLVNSSDLSAEYKILPSQGKGKPFLTMSEKDYVESIYSFFSDNKGLSPALFNPIVFFSLIAGFGYIFLKNDLKKGFSRTKEMVNALSGTYDEDNRFGVKVDALKIGVSVSQFTFLAPLAVILDTVIDVVEFVLNFVLFVVNKLLGKNDLAEKNLITSGFALVGIVPFLGDWLQDGKRFKKIASPSLKKILSEGFELSAIRNVKKHSRYSWWKKVRSWMSIMDETLNELVLKSEKLGFELNNLRRFSFNTVKGSAYLPSRRYLSWNPMRGKRALVHEFAHHLDLSSFKRPYKVTKKELNNLWLGEIRAEAITKKLGGSEIIKQNKKIFDKMSNLDWERLIKNKLQYARKTNLVAEKEDIYAGFKVMVEEYGSEIPEPTKIWKSFDTKKLNQKIIYYKDKFEEVYKTLK